MAIRRKLSFPTFLLAVLVAVCVVMPAVSAYATNTNVVLYASKAPVRAGSWVIVSDSTAAGGSAMTTPVSATKIAAPLASPANYFQMTFPANSGQAYHLWVRGKAANNSYTHDSAYVQFSDSVTSTGAAIDRMGTASAAAVVLQGCTGNPEQGWGWEDNGWCGNGANIYFKSTGTHTIRVQLRESGFEIDQIVLSPQTYLTAAPGSRENNNTILAANLPALGGSTPTVSMALSPSSGSVPLNVDFTANVSGATASAYNWNFGDGTTSTAALPSHTYNAAGNYTAKVTVTDSSGGTASASTVVAVNGTSSESKLRVVQANISYGGHGTDNIINLNRTTDWLVKLNPDVASLVEAIGGYNDPTLITGLMKQKTGLTWYSYYVPKYPGCPEGVMVLSKWPIVSSAPLYMSYQMPVAEATINVNGKLISFFSTHFQWPGNASAERQVEANQLVAFASKFAEPRIIAGDLNAQVYTPEVEIILQQYNGAWDEAVAKGIATAYPDNPAGTLTRSRRSRIDHIFYAKAATDISVAGAEIPDQRAPGTAALVTVKIGTTDDRGVRPSDHNFVEATLNIN
ncbi:MAG TPA: endonuclease/exonuclease/phosphatase family protein [Terriglobales bacterium]|nr:endonuclease/exonuclease/phosphatase family protein [Terriglobales bacterium]